MVKKAPERVGEIHAGHRVVGKHQIPSRPLERPVQRLDGFDPLALPEQAGHPERALDQQEIRLGVLDA